MKIELKNSPNSYKCLSINHFFNESCSLVPIRFQDRLDIMNWRNEQIYHLRQSEVLNEEKQDAYFSKVISKLFTNAEPDQLLFSMLENEICIGYGGLVHINWIDKNAEISFIMKSSLEKESFDKYWSIYLKMIENLAFKVLDLHKIYVYAFDLRPHLYNTLEKNGYLNKVILKDHISYNGDFINVVIHHKLNSNDEL